ncbi:MAG: transglutaminase domain-containing protein [Actinomycetota bacterium]
MAVGTDVQTAELEAIQTARGEIPGGPGVGVQQTDAPIGDLPVLRLAVAAGFATLAAAIMVGGVFTGVSPRIWGAVAGMLGIVAAARIRSIRNPYVMNAAIVLALFFIGILMTIPAGSASDIVNIGPFLREAVTSGDVQRPPVEFTLGWRAILGWLMGGLGFASAWIATEVRRPALGLLLPLPIVAVAAISVPDEARVASGIGSLILFAVGLGLLSGIDLEGRQEQRSVAFELRRAARALPMLGALTVALVFLSQADFLFPQPVYDPTQSAQKPKAIPLSDVPDRVLFAVQSSVSGPWRMGSLDVYDGADWRLPPFADNRIEEVPSDGILDTELEAGVKATFSVQGLDGAVLPGLPNLVGLIAEGPRLAHDGRTGVIRLASGTIQPGLEYTVTAARIPSVQELQRISQGPPDEIEGLPAERFLDIPPPPARIQQLLNQTPKTSAWDALDFLRNRLLDTVAATGSGAPVSVPPEKVEDMLFGSKEGSPFEIVAGQALLARWASIPSRIGYGFDGGEETDRGFEVRPRHGASFLEVYFPGHKWLPLIGTPRQAKTSFGDEPTQSDASILASDDFAVQLYIPFEREGRNFLFDQVRAILIVVLPIIGGVLLVYFLWPIVRKSFLRARRRSWVRDQDPWARVALAYAEFRDLATDFGYRHHSDTPLMFLDRVVPDEEHSQLAWLVTRTLWGDLREDVSEEDALAAEELSRALRKRMSQAHSWTLRAISAASRLSLRHPYAPMLDHPDRRNVAARTGEDSHVSTV